MHTIYLCSFKSLLDCWLGIKPKIYRQSLQKNHQKTNQKQGNKKQYPDVRLLALNHSLCNKNEREKN